MPGEASLIKTALIIFVCGMVSSCGGRATGYCVEQKRFISDDGLLEAAISEDLKLVRGYFPGSKMYGSPVELLQQNPDCCSVDRDKLLGDENPAASRAVGYYRAQVNLHYRWTDAPSEQMPYRWATITLNECGQLVDYTYHNSRS